MGYAQAKSKMIKNYILDLKAEFAGYHFAKFIKDLMAAITLAAVALPLALAFGVSTGVSAAAGLVTAIIAGLVISPLSGGTFQVSGPTGTMTAILVPIIATYGIQGVMVVGFFSGVALIIAGLLRLGRLVNFIPSSVITGFSSGIAVIIFLGQVDNLFRVQASGDLTITKFLSYFDGRFTPDWVTFGVGLFVIVFMLLWPKKIQVPGSLVALILVLVGNAFLKLDIETVGTIPRSLMLEGALTPQALMSYDIAPFIGPSLSIAALILIESLLCGASASKLVDGKLDPDREAIAQGLGNLLIPFFGGVPATAAFGRTSVAIKSGAQTRLTIILQAFVLLASMFVVAPLVGAIPLSALAGILVVTAWRMNDFKNIRFIFGKGYKTGMAKYLATLIATVLLDLTMAICVGVVIALAFIAVKLSRFEVVVSAVDPKRLKGDYSRDSSSSAKENTSLETVKVAYLAGNMFFSVTKKMIAEFGSIACEHSDLTHIIISMRGVPLADLSGIQALLEIDSNLDKKGIKLMFCSVQSAIYADLLRAGFPEHLIYANAEEAIASLYDTDGLRQNDQMIMQASKKENIKS